MIRIWWILTNMLFKDKDVHRTDRTVPFYAKEDMPNPDVTMHVGTNENLEKLKELLCTYNMYNTDLGKYFRLTTARTGLLILCILGYVQGMSDLLSPLYMVIQDDLVFQAFVGFMNRTVCVILCETMLITLTNSTLCRSPTFIWINQGCIVNC